MIILFYWTCKHLGIITCWYLWGAELGAWWGKAEKTLIMQSLNQNNKDGENQIVLKISLGKKKK